MPAAWTRHAGSTCWSNLRSCWESSSVPTPRQATHGWNQGATYLQPGRSNPCACTAPVLQAARRTPRRTLASPAPAQSAAASAPGPVARPAAGSLAEPADSRSEAVKVAAAAAVGGDVAAAVVVQSCGCVCGTRLGIGAAGSLTRRDRRRRSPAKSPLRPCLQVHGNMQHVAAVGAIAFAVQCNTNE